MNKLIVSVIASTALVAGASAFAQAGDAESQAGSAWRNNSQNSGYSVPNSHPEQGPRNAQEYYGNSGWTPPVYSYGGVDAWGRPIYNTLPNATAVYPPAAYAPNYGNRYERGDRHARDERGERQRLNERNARQRDRDGDGVPNNRDRYPEDSRRW
jgi:hypothetical protein